MSIPIDDSMRGQRTTCMQCGEELIHSGDRWTHNSIVQPKHSAMPVNDLLKPIIEDIVLTPRQAQRKRIAGASYDLLIAVQNIATKHELRSSEVLLIVLDYAVQYQQGIVQKVTK